MFQTAFYDLLQITPDIFVEIAIGDPKSKILIKPKGKLYQKRKILLGW